ncbi:hypothetical protein D3C72_1884310 [compost metagenome]
MLASTRLRTASLKVRTVSCMVTWSGTMLACVPPWMLPTVMTTGSIGLFSRETRVCNASTMRAAMTTGSRVSCGAAPWPPWPYTVMLMVSAAARK